MKDSIPFSANQESLQECYDQEKVAYQNVCDRTRLKALQVVRSFWSRLVEHLC